MSDKKKNVEEQRKNVEEQKHCLTDEELDNVVGGRNRSRNRVQSNEIAEIPIYKVP